MMKASLLFRKWHKWLALVIGVQLFFWTLSGLYMSFVPIETIRSEHLLKVPDSVSLNQFRGYHSIDEVTQGLAQGQDVLEVRLKTLLGKPVFEVHTSESSIYVLDGISGSTISPIKEDLARKIALSHFGGESKIQNIELITEPLIEYRGKYPVWKVDFDNMENTSFYVSPESGKVTARRGLWWRVYDFLWMLHIMDYSERKNFNNWWLVLAAFLALATSVSGLVLIRYSFKRRDFKFRK